MSERAKSFSRSPITCPSRVEHLVAAAELEDGLRLDHEEVLVPVRVEPEADVLTNRELLLLDEEQRGSLFGRAGRRHADSVLVPDRPKDLLDQQAIRPLEGCEDAVCIVRKGRAHAETVTVSCSVRGIAGTTRSGLNSSRGKVAHAQATTDHRRLLARTPPAASAQTPGGLQHDRDGVRDGALRHRGHAARRSHDGHALGAGRRQGAHPGAADGAVRDRGDPRHALRRRRAHELEPGRPSQPARGRSRSKGSRRR